MMQYDFISFFRALLADPYGVGAITPSGPALAELITREISASTGPVIELGPGTGVFTSALLRRGVREENLALIEFGSDFVRLLQLRFPDAHVLWMDAAQLRNCHLFEKASAGAVVSGLPLLTMSPRKVAAILKGAFGYLRPGGAFYQFTYANRCPVPRPLLDRLGLRSTRVGRAILNVPPATVFKLSRRKRAIVL